jgi:hypothetical protein
MLTGLILMCLASFVAGIGIGLLIAVFKEF